MDIEDSMAAFDGVDEQVKEGYRMAIVSQMAVFAFAKATVDLPDSTVELLLQRFLENTEGLGAPDWMQAVGGEVLAEYLQSVKQLRTLIKHYG